MRQQVLSLLFFSAVLLASTQIVASEDEILESCPTGITTMQNFNATKYLGLWYEIAKYPTIYEAGGKCITAEYGALSSDEVSVLNSQISELNELVTIAGTATIYGPGKLSVQFGGFAALAGPADYWVLDTDYNEYSVVYSCKNSLPTFSDTVWILARERVLSEEVRIIANDVIVNQGLSLERLRETDQSNCEE